MNKIQSFEWKSFVGKLLTSRWGKFFFGKQSKASQAIENIHNLSQSQMLTPNLTGIESF